MVLFSFLIRRRGTIPVGRFLISSCPALEAILSLLVVVYAILGCLVAWLLLSRKQTIPLAFSSGGSSLETSPVDRAAASARTPFPTLVLLQAILVRSRPSKNPRTWSKRAELSVRLNPEASPGKAFYSLCLSESHLPPKAPTNFIVVIFGEFKNKSRIKRRNHHSFIICSKNDTKASKSRRRAWIPPASLPASAIIGVVHHGQSCIPSSSGERTERQAGGGGGEKIRRQRRRSHQQTRQP